MHIAVSCRAAFADIAYLIRYLELNWLSDMLRKLFCYGLSWLWQANMTNEPTFLSNQASEKLIVAIPFDNQLRKYLVLVISV